MTEKATSKVRFPRDVHVPHVLLDAVRAHLGVLSDAEMARVLVVEAGMLSDIRHKKRSVGYSMIVAIGMKTDWLVKDIVAMSRQKPQGVA